MKAQQYVKNLEEEKYIYQSVQPYSSDSSLFCHSMTIEQLGYLVQSITEVHSLLVVQTGKTKYLVGKKNANSKDAIQKCLNVFGA